MTVNKESDKSKRSKSYREHLDKKLQDPKFRKIYEHREALVAIAEGNIELAKMALAKGDVDLIEMFDEAIRRGGFKIVHNV